MLKNEIQESISVRVYPKDFDWKFKARWKDAIPSVNFCSLEENYLSQMLKSELVIVDHLGGTTASECLYHNKPFIILANKNLFQIRDSAKKDHDRLHSVGILHYDVESAAETLNLIHDNINEWLRIKFPRAGRSKDDRTMFH